MQIEQIVFEVRYHFGTLYLDRCGRLIREITRHQSEWISHEVSVTKGTLISASNGSVLNFNSAKIDLSIVRSEKGGAIDDDAISFFEGQVAGVVPMILDRLDVESEMVHRIGCRTIVSFPLQDEKACSAWIDSKRIYDVSGFSLFDGGTLRNSSAVVVLDGEEASYRVSVAAAEQPTNVVVGSSQIEVKPRNLPKGQREALIEQQKRRKASQGSKWAVLLDIDAFRDDPDSVEPELFLRASVKKTLAFAEALGNRKSK